MKIFLFVFILLSLNSLSQGNYSTKNRKAIKLFEEARKYYEQSQNDKSIEILLSAIEKDNNFKEAHLLISYAYADLKNYDQAIKHLKFLFSLDPNFFPNATFSLARLLFITGKYKEAKQYYNYFLSTNPKNEKMIKIAKRDIENCVFAIKSIANPVEFNPVNLGENINSKFDEYYPCITADNEMILFTRKIVDEKIPQGWQEDFYVSKKNKDNQWIKAYSIDGYINTPLNEGAPTLSPDGQVIIFTACEYYGNYGLNRQGAGSCDLFFTRKIGNKWGKVVNLGTNVNTQNWESQPSLSSDGKTLYFIRGFKSADGIRHQDIYVTTLDDEGNWSKAKKLSNIINTPYEEESVFIHPDNQTLYFSSNGHIGMGGLDIFMSKKDSMGNWTTPVNLSYPINTFNDENSLTVSADGEYAFFASNRDGGFGGLDLYYFKLPDKFKPTPVTYLKGKIYDAKTKKSLEAKLELIDLKTAKLVTSSKSNPGNGEFLLCLPSNKSYALNISKKGYMFYSAHFDLKSNVNSKPIIKNIALEPIEIGKTIILKNIFFETAKYDLKPLSIAELNKVVEFLQSNKNIKIQIRGHTDNVGSEKDNQILSENRAKVVYDYLIKHNINPQRLSYKGFGEKIPIASNENEEGRALNRRTEISIIDIN